VEEVVVTVSDCVCVHALPSLLLCCDDEWMISPWVMSGIRPYHDEMRGVMYS
jgi:hypothetical protein